MIANMVINCIDCLKTFVNTKMFFWRLLPFLHHQLGAHFALYLMRYILRREGPYFQIENPCQATVITNLKEKSENCETFRDVLWICGRPVLPVQLAGDVHQVHLHRKTKWNWDEFIDIVCCKLGGRGFKSYLLPSTVCSEPLSELLAQCQWYWSKVYVPSPPPWCKAPPLMYNCAAEQWRRNPFKDFWSKLVGQRMIKTYISRIFQSNLSTMTSVFEKRFLAFKTLQKIMYDI